MMDGTRAVQYLVWPNPTNPYLLARVRWPDVFQAISPVLPVWQFDPGLFDLPYDPSSTPVTLAEAEAIAAEWGARLTSDEAARPLELMRRMPADWSNLSRAEKRAWSIQFVKPRELIATGPATAAADTTPAVEATSAVETTPSVATAAAELEATSAAPVPSAAPAGPPHLIVSSAGARRSRRPWRRRRGDGVPAIAAAASAAPRQDEFLPGPDIDVIRLSDAGEEADVVIDLSETAEVDVVDLTDDRQDTLEEA